MVNLKNNTEGQMVLPNGTKVSLNVRETGLNNNVLVLGTSGSGKSRSVVIPNMLEMQGSYIISDPKGYLYKHYAKEFEKNGYKVQKLDFVHPENSDGYNPLAYIKNTTDIKKLAHMIVYAGDNNKSGLYDPFWDRATELLVTTLIGYVLECKDKNMKNLHSLIDLLLKFGESMNNVRINGKRALGEFCRMMDEHQLEYSQRTGKESWAYKQYQKFLSVPEKTYNTILITTHAILGRIDTEEIRQMLEYNEIDINGIGERLVVTFVITSDTDRTLDFLANVFYSQAIDKLCHHADEDYADGALPVMVRFMLDDFGTTTLIDGFENMVANIRARNISAMIMVQSLAQIESRYGRNAQTIIDNMDSTIFLGSNDLSTAQYISKKANVPIGRILQMPLRTNYVFRRGEKPVFGKTVDLSEYLMESNYDLEQEV